ncbi:hypothetical protein [Spirosoma koreense]
MRVDYLIESFFVVSVDIVEDESLDMVEDESVDMVEDESVTAVVDSVVSVFVLEQAVASARMERKKNADFAMFVVEFDPLVSDKPLFNPFK